MTIGVRRAAAERYRCSHARLWWDLAWSDPVVDTAVAGRERDVATVDLRMLADVGRKAHPILAERGTAWQVVEWTLPIIRLVWPVLPPRPTLRLLQPLVDVAVGGALVSVRAAMPDPPVDLGERDTAEQARGIVVRGALVALRRAADETSHDLRVAGTLLTGTR